MDFLQNENFWLYLPMILWISGIFYLSSNRGSLSNTSQYINPFFNSLFPQATKEDLAKYHHYLRKTAHFVVYATLGLFASIAFYFSTINFLADFWSVSAFVLSVIVASADELKQSFYADRHGSVSDVILDGFGSLTMIFFLCGVKLTLRLYQKL